MTPILAADWLTISINLLLVIHVIVCILLALVVLMQRPKQEGLGAAFGGGVTDLAFGAQTTNVLQKGTVYLGTLFFVITLILAILIGKRQASDPSLANSEKAAQEETESPATDALNEKKPEIVPPTEEGEDGGDTPAPPAPPTPPAPAPTPAPADDAGTGTGEATDAPAAGDDQGEGE
ncbi:MAG: preprotein translocase subunit SecG [Akkermansiaceae bacterium]